MLIRRRENAATEDVVQLSAYSRSSSGSSELPSVQSDLHQPEGMPDGMFAESPESWIELDWVIFPAMCHVTLHWDAKDRVLRRDLETELANALRQTTTRNNPVGGWMISLAICLFFLSTLGLLAVLVLRILQLPI
jgi:hypothetical protein